MSAPNTHPDAVADELRLDKDADRGEEINEHLDQTERLTDALSIGPDE